MTNVRLSSSSRAASPIDAERLDLVHLAVAEERPDVLVRRVLDAAVVQVAVELRLVDGVDRPKAHRDRGELPEVGHEPRVRVRGQAPGGVRELLPEAVQPVFVQTTLEEGARVDAGRGVALEVDLVAATGVVGAAEEVVEAHLVQRGAGGIRRDVATHADPGSLCAVHHDRRVPPHVGADAPFDPLIAWEPRLLLRWNRVDVVGRRQRRDTDVALAGALQAG